MADEIKDYPIRHVILYAKGHYYWNRLNEDLLKICKKVDSRTSKTKHIIQIVGELVYSAIQEYKSSNFMLGKDRKDLGPVDAYIDQWVLLVSLREKFKVDWLKHPIYTRLSFEEQDQLNEVFQEEFNNRILQAFISPLAGWDPKELDLGEPSGSILPVVSPERKKNEKK